MTRRGRPPCLPSLIRACPLSFGHVAYNRLNWSIGYDKQVIIDFHCHITTPRSRLPEAEGDYYRTLPALSSASTLLGPWTQEAMDLAAERLRTPAALKAYRTFGPLIYTEMSRRMVETPASALLAEMAANGVSQSVVVAIDSFVPTTEVLDACAHLPGLLLPFGSCDPHTSNYEENFAHLLTLPILGIKFHSDLQQLPLDSPKLFAMLHILAASDKPYLPVYLHTGSFPIYRPLETPWPAALLRLLAEFPTLTFVCGHAGWDAPGAALKAALSHPNLFLETSWQPPRLLRRLCDKLGPERLLLGSDYPLYSQKRALRNARTAFTETEFALIASENAKKLLRLQAGYNYKMSALDRYHETVRHALSKDGWTITHDPLTLEFGERRLYADFGAERLMGAERGTEKIAVEIKTFRSPYPIADLEQAIGQYSLYEDILQILEAERTLFLAIPEEAFAQIFSEQVGQIALKNRIKRAFVFSPTTEEINQWLP